MQVGEICFKAKQIYGTIEADIENIGGLQPPQPPLEITALDSDLSTEVSLSWKQ